ncbi:hypothetical protein OWM07_06235 [Deferribacter thermophilus]|uniref:hypothetical protein n=1 Tax=Deferribacter thermophilus TaxID=53573 RepID=UPI003C1B83A8
MKEKVLAAVSSFLGFFASFLPVAISKEGYYVNFTHIKGVSYLYPLFPLILLIIIITKIYKKEFPFFTTWSLIIGLFSLVLCAYITILGESQLEMFVRMFNIANNFTVKIGYGSVIYVLSIVLAIVLANK